MGSSWYDRSMIETFIQHHEYKRLLIGNRGTMVSTTNWIQLKTHISPKGYEELKYRIGSRTDGSRKTLNLKVHRLVANMYIGNVDNKPTVNHKDGDKLNQDYENLEWATWRENNIHALKTGLRKPTLITKEHREKLIKGYKKAWESGKIKRKRNKDGTLR